MDGPEFFSPTEGGESYDPAAFERFREQMKKNAAAMAASRKSEQKQKEKEDCLAQLLLRFIQQHQKSGILMLAAKLLQENIPASFILSMIILGNSDLQEELKKELSRVLPPRGDVSQAHERTEFSVAIPSADQTLPLHAKAEIDAWWKGIFNAALAIPFYTLEKCLDREGNIKKIILDCSANVLDDFLASQGLPQISFNSCFSFCEFCMKGIFCELKKQIEN